MPRTHNITLGMALVSMLVLFTSELGAYTVTATAWTSGGTSTTTGGTGSTGSGTGTGGGTIVPDPLVLESTSLDDAYVNEDYSMELALSGGTAPYTFSATGLPSGLSIDPVLATFLELSLTQSRQVFRSLLTMLVLIATA